MTTEPVATDTPASRHKGYMMGLQSVESFVPLSLLPENATLVTHSKIYRYFPAAKCDSAESRPNSKLLLLSLAAPCAMQGVGSRHGSIHSASASRLPQARCKAHGVNAI